MVPVRVLWEALKLARLIRVANESGTMVRWFSDTSLVRRQPPRPWYVFEYRRVKRLGTYSLTS